MPVKCWDILDIWRKKMNPLVSVIVPLYNYEKYIKWCIKSILKQDYDNFEVIVINDCSTDGSVEVINSFPRDFLTLLTTQTNSGYSVCKNIGISSAKGDIITVLDADDMMTQKSISSRVKALLKYDVDFIHAKAITVGPDVGLKQAYTIDPKKATRGHARIHAQTVLYKRDIHKKFGLYDENLRSRADKEMWCRLFGYNDNDEQKVAKKFIDYDVAYYRHHKKSMMQMRRKKPQYNDEVTRILKEQYELRKREGITRENTKFLED